MSTTTDRLDAFHGVFLQALNADPAPLAEARFWFEGMAFDRDSAAPRATCRGTSFLHYQRGTWFLQEVPGQKFAQDALPHFICTALISEAAADWAGPRTISFRYDRVDSAWSGGYAIETSAEYKQQVLTRKPLDALIAESMRDHWEQDVTKVKFLLGGGPKDKEGPHVMIYRKGAKGPSFVPPSAGVKQAWDALKRHVERDRFRVYSASLLQEVAGAALIEGDTIEMQYGR